MKIKNNQSGFAHLAAILVVVTVLAIGTVGWKVWDNQRIKKSASSSNSSDLNSGKVIATEESNGDDKALVFEKWNAKLSLDNQKYEYTLNYVKSDSDEYYEVYNDIITEQCGDMKTRVASVDRHLLTDKDVLSGKTYAETYSGEAGGTEFNKWKKIGKYIYRFNAPQVGCPAGVDTNGMANEIGKEHNNITTAFIAQISKFEVIE